MRLALVLAFAVVGCHAQAEVSTGGSAKGNVERDESFSASEPTPAPTTTAAPTAEPTTPTAPPPDACPLSCYVASGASHFPVSDQEAASIRTALEPTLSSMRACTTVDHWRRRGSPVLHLRVAPDGQVTEVDVDPHHSYEYEAGCMNNAARGGINLSLPGSFAVRCAERCVRPATQKRRR